MSNFVNLLDIVYPVDSVYITFSATSPADTVGGGQAHNNMPPYITVHMYRRTA